MGWQTDCAINLLDQAALRWVVLGDVPHEYGCGSNGLPLPCANIGLDDSHPIEASKVRKPDQIPIWPGNLDPLEPLRTIGLSSIIISSQLTDCAGIGRNEAEIEPPFHWPTNVAMTLHLAY